MTDEGEPGPEAGYEERSAASPDGVRPVRRSRPDLRRHLTVLGIAVVGIVVGIVLVVSGRNDHPQSASGTSTSTSTPTVAAGRLLPDLGVVADTTEAAARIGALDPETLRPIAGSTSTTSTNASAGVVTTSPAGVDLTEAGLQRCNGAIIQQNSDRSLGDRLAAARLVVDDTATLVLSYRLPASGSSPAGIRIIVADARTCRVITAVEP